MQPLYGQLYQFSEVMGRMSLPVHQYLLATEPSVMFATGTSTQADWILPQIELLLEGRPLSYLVISHMESDECGGYRQFHKKYPKMTILCSQFTANELKGFGYKGRITIVDENSSVNEGQIALRFLRYPAEVHLRDGILCTDTRSGVVYSSDLMYHHMSDNRKVIEDSWENEVGSIGPSQIPDDVRRQRLVDDLSKISPKFIATGHGSCVKCTGNGQ
ncbi:MAG: flavoprotein [archaeon]|nr:flavoprotein [archaeon]